MFGTLPRRARIKGTIETSRHRVSWSNPLALNQLFMCVALSKTLEI